LTDTLLVATTASEAIILAIGVVLAYRLATMGGRSPRGWILITAAFALALVRALIFLYVFATSTASVDVQTWLAQVITLPIAALVLAGVYYLYVEFKRVLSRNEIGPQVPVESART
jgi:hypothetical protein